MFSFVPEVWNYVVFVSSQGRLQPTKDDKENFVNELRETFGVLSSRLELFRRYLDGNDDVKGEHVSKLENGLFFYLEVQKFKVRY